jgi:hypothetical protein
MGYSGAVSREQSSVKRMQRGQITKTGNAHLRRIAMEAAWAYRHRPTVGAALRKRQKGFSEGVLFARPSPNPMFTVASATEGTEERRAPDRAHRAIGRQSGEGRPGPVPHALRDRLTNCVGRARAATGTPPDSRASDGAGPPQPGSIPAKTCAPVRARHARHPPGLRALQRNCAG